MLRQCGSTAAGPDGKWKAIGSMQAWSILMDLLVLLCYKCSPSLMDRGRLWSSHSYIGVDWKTGQRAIWNGSFQAI